MKKTITLLALLLTLTSYAQELLLTADTTLQGNQTFSIVRTNGYALDVNGALNVTNFIMLNKGSQSDGGTITATNINVGSNVFFFSDNGTLKSTGGISVSGDTKGKGTVVYCDYFNSGFLDSEVVVVQDCTLSVPKVGFNFEKAIPLYYIDLTGKRTKNLQYATGLFIGVYELNGKKASRKELWKQGILISAKN